MFGTLIHHGVLTWLDDLLGYAVTEDDLCDLFDAVMKRCAQYGFKLHPAKCIFFPRTIKRSGRVISDEDVTHCPERTQDLVDLTPPVTG
ncbi:Retrotransposon protein, Ty3-gypsy subclass [Phytophthora megakarya]|uniref:Retrotransposon protein, Ty3-gypsy subclass n=1 Tax=Phytophthora megakarya TaxID=4795 RepID=A0A225V2F0_9STRA|nr:Retrotransposon protein, Ty3-gypsy subclass [Phytophthora megakarya]